MECKNIFVNSPLEDSCHVGSLLWNKVNDFNFAIFYSNYFLKDEKRPHNKNLTTVRVVHRETRVSWMSGLGSRTCPSCSECWWSSSRMGRVCSWVQCSRIRWITRQPYGWVDKTNTYIPKKDIKHWHILVHALVNKRTLHHWSHLQQY